MEKIEAEVVEEGELDTDETAEATVEVVGVKETVGDCVKNTLVLVVVEEVGVFVNEGVVEAVSE